MERLKAWLRRLFCLPLLPTILIAVPAFAFVSYVLGAGMENSALAYLSYLLSAYAAVITVTGVVRILRMVRREEARPALVQKISGNPTVARFRSDVAFRSQASLYLSLAINLLYVVLKLASGIWYRSVWYGTLAVYYGLLAVMRFLLLRYVRRKQRNLRSELRRYRLCGILLLWMTMALAGVVILALHMEGGFDYPGNLIYLMALYTFFSVITAVKNLIKFRKYGSPVLSAAKAVSLATALVSMLSLETAMLARFGAADDVAFRQLMTGLTGAAVCSFVLGMAAFMIIRANRAIKRQKAGGRTSQ